MGETLNVRAVGSSLVQDFERMADGVRAYVGRKFDPALNGWAPCGAVSIPARSEYVRAIADGDLELVPENTKVAK